MKSGSCHDFNEENYGDEPVDGGAERRPPPCAGDVVAALLPEVLEAMACVAQDQEPGRSGDGRAASKTKAPVMLLSTAITLGLPSATANPM